MALIHYEMRVKICCLMTSYLLFRTVFDLPCIDVETRGAKGHSTGMGVGDTPALAWPIAK